MTNVYEREYFRILSEKAVRRLCECGYLNMIKTVDEIADILEEPVEKIQKICEISENYAPDYDAQKIYQELENSEY